MVRYRALLNLKKYATVRYCDQQLSDEKDFATLPAFLSAISSNDFLVAVMTVNPDVPKTLLELNEEYITRQNEAIQSKQQLAVKVASIPVEAVSWKTGRRMTAYPLFAPDKRNCFDIFEYISPDGSCRVKVFPDAEYGQAKVWDADVFNYFLSRAYTAYQQTEQIPSRIETSAYQILKHLNRNPRSGKNNAWLREAIRRLSGTRYKTTIFHGTREAETGFHLIDYSFYNLEGSKAEKRETIGRIIIWFNVDLYQFFKLAHVIFVRARPLGGL